MTLQQIQERLDAGETVVSFVSDDPKQARKNLEKQARRRGLLWSFAILENEVFVRR